jgi:hypothetical protein
MSWTNVGYILFQVGALFATGIVIHGGWLYLTTPEVNPHNAPGDGQPGGVTPEAKPVPTLFQN